MTTDNKRVVKKFKVYCTEGDGYQYLWLGASGVTQCPVNAAHTIDDDQTTVVEVVGDDNLTTDDDGRLIMAPSLMPESYTGQFMGIGDDYDAGSRGDSPTKLFVEMPDGDPVLKSTRVQAVDVTYALGCTMKSMNGNSDDYINIFLKAAATPVVPNASTEGNCTLVQLPGAPPGACMICPVPGSGNYDVDLTTPVNANLAGPDPVFVSQATPIPAEDVSGNVTKFNGFWHFDEATGAITPAYDRTGRYNLYTFPITLTRWVKRWSVWTPPGSMYENEFFIHNKGAKILPHWYLTLETTRAASHAPSDPAVQYQFYFYVARKKTV